MKILLLVTSLTLASCCSSKPLVVEESKLSLEHGEKVFIVNHGWHTGFVIPAKSVLSELPLLRKRFGDVLYLEFGWGDSGFYQASEITSALTVQAVFWPTDSVVHVVEVPQSPELYFKNSEVKSIYLDNQQLALLLTYLCSSFAKKDDQLISMKKGIYGNSQFYKGEGSYYLMNTCNKWTAKGLKSAQRKVDPLFMLTAGSVMDSLAD